MSKLIISLSYKLEVSSIYKKFKTFIYNILENSSYKYKKYFDFTMIFLVLSTIGILIFEVNHKKSLPILELYESFAIVIFIIEYLGRLWVHSDMHSMILEDYENSQILNKKYKINKSLIRIIKNKFDFIFSPMALIDLLAILPYYRPLRILRIFLIFRLFKILRYSNSLKEFLHVFKERKFELFTLGLLYITIVFFGSTIIFIYEGPIGVNDDIVDFFDAIYWSVITISTVGFGDIVPITVEGKIVTTILVISAFLLIAFGTSIITTGLSERMENIKEERIQAEASKMKDFTIICGFGTMGEYFCKSLSTLNKKFIIIDIDKKRIDYAKSQNYLAVCADSTNMNSLENIGINSGAKAAVVLTNDDAINLSIILGARALSSSIEIISRVNKESNKSKFYIAGANKTILFNEATAFVATQYLNSPIAFNVVDGILLDKEAQGVIDEIEISNSSRIINKNVNTIDFDKYSLTLIGITNSKKLDDFTFNPINKNYIIKAHDILIVIGFKISISQLKADLINQEF